MAIVAGIRSFLARWLGGGAEAPVFVPSLPPPPPAPPAPLFQGTVGEPPRDAWEAITWEDQQILAAIQQFPPPLGTPRQTYCLLKKTWLPIPVKIRFRRVRFIMRHFGLSVRPLQ